MDLLICNEVLYKDHHEDDLGLGGLRSLPGKHSILTFNMVLIWPFILTFDMVLIWPLILTFCCLLFQKSLKESFRVGFLVS